MVTGMLGANYRIMSQRHVIYVVYVTKGVSTRVVIRLCGVVVVQLPVLKSALCFVSAHLPYGRKGWY